MSRPLTESEIQSLESRGCSAQDWSLVSVSDDFDAKRIRDVDFYGHVSLGSMAGYIDLAGVGLVHPEIVRATLCDVSIGDTFYIKNVGLISGYVIGDRFVCVGTGRIIAGKGSCGIGRKVDVVNEGGGRSVALSTSLTSNIAYMISMHAYRPGLVEGYNRLVEKERLETKHAFASNVKIYGVGLIKDVAIGDYAVLDGVSALRSGNILSCEDQPTRIGADVDAEGFVFAEGAKVFGGAKLREVFIGQCAEVGQGFVAENLLAFANCQLLCGEAVSVLAGPYTVSHHKTSLLIAGAYSFFNAGSATNASNHHYRLGPVHQAVYDRGVKTGSGSYLLQPAHIGQFSLVVGHHRTNPDISAYPFSVLLERDGETHLLIAQNLKTMGVFRDGLKWKKRDKRVEHCKADAISFSVLNPITVGQMMSATLDMESRYENTKSEHIVMGGVRIRRALLPRATKSYRTAIDYFLARAYLHDNGASEGLECQWVDCGGLVMPDFELQAIEDKIANDEYASVSDIVAAFQDANSRRKEQVLHWAVGKARAWYGYSGLADDLVDATQRVAEASRDLRESLVADAVKEWLPKLTVSYGLDGSDDDQMNDYRRIHGAPEENPDVQECQRYFDQTW